MLVVSEIEKFIRKNDVELTCILRGDVFIAYINTGDSVPEQIKGSSKYSLSDAIESAVYKFNEYLSFKAAYSEFSVDVITQKLGIP